MKIVRYIMSGVTDNYRFDSSCYYIPSEKAILCESESISWRTEEDYDKNHNYYVTRDENKLAQAEAIAKGEIPKNEIVSFSIIKTIEIQDEQTISQIHDLIKDTKELGVLEKKVKRGFSDINKLTNKC